MKFRSRVEPPEPMRGLEVPRALVEELAGGARPPVKITINGHTWRSRIAIMRGRCLIGLSIANRRAAGVATGDKVEVELALDTAPRVATEPPDFARALDAKRGARAAYNALTNSQRRVLVLGIERAKQPETRARRIEQTIAKLKHPRPAVGGRSRGTVGRTSARRGSSARG